MLFRQMFCPGGPFSPPPVFPQQGVLWEREQGEGGVPRTPILSVCLSNLALQPEGLRLWA